MDLGGDVCRRLGECPQQERRNVLLEVKLKRDRRKCRRPILHPRNPLGERIALLYCRQLVGGGVKVLLRYFLPRK